MEIITGLYVKSKMFCSRSFVKGIVVFFLLDLCVMVASAQDFVLKNNTDGHFSILQTISGTTSGINITGNTLTDNAGNTFLKSNDSNTNFVHLTGNETISGNKIFTNGIFLQPVGITPVPTNTYITFYPISGTSLDNIRYDRNGRQLFFGQNGYEKRLLTTDDLVQAPTSGGDASFIFVGGTAPQQASAVLEIQSTTKGFLPPKMTSQQKLNIASPVEGLMVYDITLHKLCVWTDVGNGTMGWQAAW